MKIAQVIPFFAPAWGYGGPVKVCFELSRELSKRSYRVTVLTTDAYDHLKRIDKVCEEMDGIKVLRFRNISNTLAKKANLYLPRGFKKYFKQNVKNYDLVHLHAFYTFQNAFASRYCVKAGVPYVLHLHEKFDATAQMGKSAIKKLFMSLYGKYMIANASQIFVLSKNEKENLLAFDQSLKEKIKIIPNPAPGYQGKCHDQAQVRKKYGFTKNNKVILSLSRLSSFKGIDLLVKAFTILVKKDSEFKLIIAGPDESGQRSKIEQIIKAEDIQDQVIFTGIADPKMKDELFCAADIFALFSRYESFGITVLESLAHGIPVCLSKNVGLAKEVRKGGCAIICDPCSPEKSALQLEKTFNLRKKLGKNCQITIGDFSLDKITDQVVSIYKRII